MIKFNVTIHEANNPNVGAFIYRNVEAKSKRDAIIETMELHRDVFRLRGQRLDGSARCVREGEAEPEKMDGVHELILTENFEIGLQDPNPEGDGYGWFEHDEYGDEYGGGLWFKYGELVDYDGISGYLPKEILDALEYLGFNVDGMRPKEKDIFEFSEEDTLEA